MRRDVIVVAAASCACRILIAITAASTGLAQSGKWSAPELGHIFDPEARTIRIISGVAGAAGIDETLAVPRKLAGAAIAPHRNFALGFNHEDGRLLIIRWTADGVTAEPLEGAPASFEAAVFNAEGSAAAVSTGESVQIWTGLPDAPVLTRELAAPGLTALALSDDAALLAAVFEGDLLLWSGDEPRVIAHGAYSALTFRKAELAAADAEIDQVVLIRNLAGEPELTVLAGPAEGVAGPAALAASADGRALFVANRRGRSLLAIEIESRAVIETACECEPSTLAPLKGDALFAVTDLTQEQFALFDAAGTDARILPIPTAGGNR
ncbi:MAG: hypothetical protein HYS04_12235 [Acidobacteria bacterium]|nr:hypothetical protein [Acidobacteriota bacterium]